jgi:hypothetical protein
MGEGAIGSPAPASPRGAPAQAELPARTRQGLAFLGAALVLGLLADALLQLVPDRLNLVLGLDAMVLVVVALTHTGFMGLPARLGTLAAPILLLGLALLWHDSPVLFALNLAGVASVAVLAAPRLRSLGTRLGTADYALGAVDLAGASAMGAPALLLTDIDWAAMPDGNARRLRGLSLGLAVSVPVAFVFAGLLMQADAAFDTLLSRALDVEWFVEHGARVGLVAWLAAGLLRGLAGSVSPSAIASRRAGSLGLGEIGPVLATVDLLFLLFVAVQFRYLFGGGELVRTLTGLSYAEYARRGFFELVAVAALTLPLLLVADHFLDRSDGRRVRRFRQLAGLMLILLDVMLASALLRMWLYTTQFGLTELRFYTTAFMAWLVLVLGWFAATVLRGRRERFAAGALVGGWLVLAAINLVNPDRVIAEVNLSRAAQGRPLDVAYAATLSADALATYRRRLPQLGTNEACETAQRLNDRWNRELHTNKRWTIALAQAPRGQIGCGLP